MRDNQPKHRQRAKERRKIERKTSGRKERSTALMVCEGEKTEPNYLRGLLRQFKISPTSAVIREGNLKTDAVSVVTRARDEFRSNNEYDRVFAVFDAEHSNLRKALALCGKPVQRKNKKENLPEIYIEPIVSNPCIEFWLLLHFTYSDRPFCNCAEVFSELSARLPDYSKADQHVFERIGGEQALNRAIVATEQLKKSLAQTGADSPNTDMPLLVKALRNMTR